MNIYGIIYESDGFIVSVIKDPLQFDPLIFVGGQAGLLIESELPIHPDTHCVFEGEVVELTPFPLVSVAVTETLTGTYLITITDIPAGSTVLWPDQVTSNEDDGIVECEVEFVGDYGFLLQHTRYFSSEVTANVTA